ncbi:hypothetical protein [Halobacillus sp. KGW1]|uniref:hypothetical protein n=1 Tax=Halobacillus sp. KGW1 TaxID=1793726 RepID=UPI00078652A4|nr:hypothetical protein [Halobacillus sp. KGW1]
MPKGIIIDRYLYPEFLDLKLKDINLMNMEGKEYGIIVANHINAVNIVDFNNQMIINDVDRMELKHSIAGALNPTMFIKQGENHHKIVDYDERKDTQRIFTNEVYTDIFVAYEVDDLEEGLKEDNKISTKALNEFLLLYRNISRMPSIRAIDNITDRDILFFRSDREYIEGEDNNKFVENLAGNMPYTQVPVFIKMSHNSWSPSQTNETISEVIKERLRFDLLISDYEELIGKAAEELHYFKNPKYAYLDTFIAIESYVTEKITEYKEHLGINSNKIKHYKTEITFAYKMDIELPMILKNNLTEKEIQLIGEIKGFAKKRNSVVHSKEKVEFHEANNALEKSLIFFKLLDEKFKVLYE